jgi:hypothetical protein
VLQDSLHRKFTTKPRLRLITEVTAKSYGRENNSDGRTYSSVNQRWFGHSRETLVLIGRKKKALGIAVRNNRPQRRYSGLLPSFERRLTECVGLKGLPRGGVVGACANHHSRSGLALSALHPGELCGHFAISYGKSVNAVVTKRRLKEPSKFAIMCRNLR